MSSLRAAVDVARMPEQSPTLSVKNTFIVAGLARSSSLDDFFKERQVCSCPSSPLSRSRCMELCSASLEGEQTPLEFDVGSSLSTADTEDDVLVNRARSDPQMLALGTRTAPPAPDPPQFQIGASSASSFWEARLGPRPPWRAPYNGAPATASRARLHSGAAPFRSCAETMQSTIPQAGRPLPTSLQMPSAVDVTSGTATQQDAFQLLSIGSAGHYLGQCKPCAFVHTDTCANGYDCVFCHLCEAGEKRRRQKEKRAFKIAARESRNARRQTMQTSAAGYGRPPRSQANV